MKLGKYIAIAVMLMMLACSEPIKVEPYTYQQVFTGETQRSWTIRSVQYVENGKGAQVIGLSSCGYADSYTFYNNLERSLQVTTKCNASDPSSVAQNTWSFENATSTLSMIMPLLDSPPYSQIPFVVKEIDDTKMVLDVYLNEGKTAAYRFNFKIASGE